jgi:hypothetical protein
LQLRRAPLSSDDLQPMHPRILQRDHLAGGGSQQQIAPDLDLVEPTRTYPIGMLLGELMNPWERAATDEVRTVHRNPKKDLRGDIV